MLILSKNLRPPRRGSVLLIAVVLLVILAILGSTYVLTARSDRVTSDQTVLNTQADAIAQGIAAAAQSAIFDDLNDPVGNVHGMQISTDDSQYTNLGTTYLGTTTYSQGQIVNDGNTPPLYYVYVNSTASTGQPLANNPTYWRRISYHSSYQGAYVTGSGQVYNYGDIVSYSANPATTPPVFYTYVNTIPTSGQALANNTSYWQLTSHYPITGGGFQPWLASRIPSVPTVGQAAAPNPSSNWPFWQNLSESESVNSSSGVVFPISVIDTPFESPEGSFESPTTGAFTYTKSDGSSGSLFSLTLAPSMPLYPGYATLFTSTGQLVPTLSTVAPTYTTSPPAQPLPILGNGSNTTTVIAADADGDGIADSLLFRIPGAYLDGLTWYAGVRVVDNNSAINVNAAWSRDQDYVATGTGATPQQYIPPYTATSVPNWGFFPSNVGLLELTNSNDQNGGSAASNPPIDFQTSGSINSPNYKGTYSALFPYSYGNIVSDGAASPSYYRYISATPTSGAALSNTAYWYLIPTGFNNYRFSDPPNGSPALNANPVVQPTPYDETMLTPYTTSTSPNASPQAPYASAGPLGATYPPYYAVPQGFNGAPTGNYPPERFDFQYITEGDAFYHQSSQRIANPGLNLFTSTSSGAGFFTRFNAIPQSESAIMAYHFGLLNPLSLSSKSLLETLLSNSLLYYTDSSNTVHSIPSSPYGSTPLTDVVSWYNNSFNYAAAGNANTMPIRQLLTARNPVDNYVTPVYDPNNIGEPLNTLYSVGGSPLTTQVTLTVNAATPYTVTYNYAQLGAMMPPYGVGNEYGVSNAGVATTGFYNHYRGQWTSTSTYYFNDIVLFAPGADSPAGTGSGTPSPTAPGFTFICTAGVNSSITGVPGITGAAYTPATITNPGTGWIMTVNPGWQLQPWSSHPTKGNVNTATFRELFRDYWSAMAGNPANLTPFGTPSVLAATGPNLTFDPNPYDYSGTYYNTFKAVAAPTITSNPLHQFRSPLRDPNYSNANANYTQQANNYTTRLDSTNTMLLRSAIAAVNTLGQRSGSQNVISRTVFLNAYVTPPPAAGVGAVLTPVQARVYSDAPQPVISAVYANTYNGTSYYIDGTQSPPVTDLTTPNPKGYVAVELYNPYPFPLEMTQWQLGVINRPSGLATYPSLSITPIGANNGTTISATEMIPELPTALADANNNGAGAPTVNELPNNIFIPAHGYALLENYNGGGVALPSGLSADPNDATYRPIDAFPAVPVAGPPQTNPSAVGVWSGPPATNNTVDVWVTGLHNVIQDAGMTNVPGGELVLLRPRRADGTYTNVTDPTGIDTFNEGSATAPNLYDLVPVDSYDFTGLAQNGTAGQEITYTRAKGTNGATNYYFKGTYPGRYDATSLASGQMREVGTAPIQITNDATPGPDPWTASSYALGPKFGQVVAPPYNYVDTFPPIQIDNQFDTTGTSVFNSLVTATGTVAATTPKFPFGGFARNGDILSVPYIGAYRIQTLAPVVTIGGGTIPAQIGTAAFVELNSLPMDCSFADDGDDISSNPTNDDTVENIGRFCPILDRLSTLVPANISGDYYSWCGNLFNYLTAQSTDRPNMPDVDPGMDPVTGLSKYSPTPTPVPPSPYVFTYPTPVFTRDATATDQTSQDNAGAEGLININTASWKVLSMLPMIPGAGHAAANEQLAQAIVNWRDGNANLGITAHGPFMSIFDLNKVTGFQTAEGTFPSGTDPTYMGVTNTTGLNDPNFPTATAQAATNVTGPDFRDDFMVLNRISNLITTKSDTFTVYVVVEGWQNAVLPGQVAGTNPPQLKVTRRFAYIIDRSAINANAASHTLNTIAVPNN